MASTTSTRNHEVQQNSDCWNDWNSPALSVHQGPAYTTPMRAMEGRVSRNNETVQCYIIH